MKKKDIILFEKTIHEIKAIVKDLTDERTEHYKEMRKARRKHDKTIKKMISEAKEAISDLYILYDDLSDKEGK